MKELLKNINLGGLIRKKCKCGGVFVLFGEGIRRKVCNKCGKVFREIIFK